MQCLMKYTRILSLLSLGKHRPNCVFMIFAMYYSSAQHLGHEHSGIYGAYTNCTIYTSSQRVRKVGVLNKQNFGTAYISWIMLMLSRQKDTVLYQQYLP